MDCGNGTAAGVNCWEILDTLAKELFVAAERCFSQLVIQAFSHSTSRSVIQPVGQSFHQSLSQLQKM